MRTKMVRDLLLISFAILLTGAAAPQAPPISASEAAHHIGETRVVCGRVVETTWKKDSKNRPTFLNFDRPYPNQTFNVVIWERVRSLFTEPPEKKFANMSACVMGEIRSYRNRPEIEVNQPSQIWIAKEH